MNKKAQGLSMTTIVVAALALLVLVVLALVFTGRMGEFSAGVKDAATCNQACAAAGLGGSDASATCDADDKNRLPGFKDDCCCTDTTT